jgi:hypothetical protein
MRLFSQSPKKAPLEKDLEKCLSSSGEQDVVADPVRSEGGEKALSYKSEFVELAMSTMRLEQERGMMQKPSPPSGSSAPRLRLASSGEARVRK